MNIKRAAYESFRWQRTQAASAQTWQQVQQIVETVRDEKDAAVRRFTAQFDGCRAAERPDYLLRVPEEAMHDAWENLDAELRLALQQAARRIRRFHEAQRPKDFELAGDDGERLGMTWRALQRVGVYAPGGRAAYPSTVLMNVIPAQVAGVQQIVLASPPARGTELPHPLVLAAAHLTGIHEVYRMGGAQAIAAFAYGTESVKRVNKIVGPGNLYVALAKRAVMGDVGIDSIAGPSEVFVVADEAANPVYVAADMLAQAEHDPEAGAVCVTTSQAVADAVEAELARQLPSLPRKEIAEAALSKWGAVVLVQSLEQAMQVVNDSAPEHVELQIQNAKAWLPSLRYAGAVFLGAETPEPVGDYFAGPNHVLPTHGSARYASGLGVLDFCRRMTYVEYNRDALSNQSGHIMALARAEGLGAHARSIAVRMEAADLEAVRLAKENSK